MNVQNKVNVKVDFYLIDANNALAAWRFACHLAEQFYSTSKRLFLYMRSQDEALRMDNLLWTYKDISFLPHTLDQMFETSPPPIVIGYADIAQNSHSYDVLINLSDNIPPAHATFPHLIEIVYGESLVQQRARERYRYYRDQKFTLNTIKT